MSAPSHEDRAAARILRFLVRHPATVEKAGAPGMVVLRNGDASIAAAQSLLRKLARDGRLIVRDERVALAAQPAGGDGAGSGSDAFHRQHRETEERRMETPDGMATVAVNLSESPLGQLARYRLRDGSPFVSGAEVDAGERLRADYTCGLLVPRVGVNWEAAVAPGRRAAGGGMADLTDAALAARQRVDRALAAVGPELAGVLVDVCCFLKGLELVERERGWPVRSAKVVLKTALAALSRHYMPPARQAQGTHGRVLHWGSQDYRPELR